jgi:hypothetical protein
MCFYVLMETPLLACIIPDLEVCATSPMITKNRFKDCPSSELATRPASFAISPLQTRSLLESREQP